MQSVYDKRRENLRRLIGQWGGPTSLSKKLGHANGSFLAQIAGPHPRREISERTARSIEGTLGLPLGWMKVLPNRMNNYLPQERRIRLVG